MKKLRTIKGNRPAQAYVKTGGGEYVIYETSREQWLAVSFPKGDAHAMLDMHKKIARMEQEDLRGPWLFIKEYLEESKFEPRIIIKRRYCPPDNCRFIPYF